jgi:hypothetical protein
MDRDTEVDLFATLQSLIALHVWTAVSTYEVLGDFGESYDLLRPDLCASD